MDTVLASLLETTIIEALKILGPAIVAALATYKATKIQYDLKLKEIDKAQGFKARENLVEHYKNQKSRVDEGYQSLSNLLGQALGMAVGALNEDDDEIDDISATMVGVADMYIGMAPFDLETTLRDMKAVDLADTSEYEKLESYVKPASELNATRNLGVLKSNIYLLLEVYAFMGRCNQMMLEKQIHSLFEGYVEDA